MCTGRCRWLYRRSSTVDRQVKPDSIAEKGGLHAGDIVVKMAGCVADGIAQMAAQDAVLGVGSTLEIIVERWPPSSTLILIQTQRVSNMSLFCSGKYHTYRGRSPFVWLALWHWKWANFVSVITRYRNITNTTAMHYKECILISKLTSTFDATPIVVNMVGRFHFIFSHYSNIWLLRQVDI